MRVTVLGCVVLMGCGVGSEGGAVTPSVGVVHQAGKTGQGKTGQGKTGQGDTIGVSRAVVRGSFSVRTGYNPKTGYTSYAVGRASLKLVGSKPGTELMVGSTVINTESATDQLSAPLATFTMQELDALGEPLYGSNRAARIVNSMVDTDTTANLMGAGFRDVVTNSANGNVLRWYRIQVPSTSAPGQWENLCQGAGTNGWAVVLPGYFSRDGAFVGDSPYYYSFACLDGTAAKCLRWGYRPWLSLLPSGKAVTAVSLEPLWRACYRAASADYCNDGRGFTYDGTPIDLWDRYGFITKTPESLIGWDGQSGALPDAYSDEGAFDQNGAVCLVRERWYDLDQTRATCRSNTQYLNGSQFCLTPSADGTWSSCGPKGTVSTPTNIFDRGGLTCSQVAARPPLVFVASAPSCVMRHDPFITGWALPADCNFTTATVCADRAKCCAEDQNGVPLRLDNQWDQTCVTMAHMVAAGTYLPGSMH